MAVRRYRLNGIKVHRNYTVDEVARSLKVAKGTVRRWLKGGLPAIADRRPLLILGRELIEFLTRRAPIRSRCQLDECYCFSCRAPRHAAFGEAEFIPLSASSGNLRALCETCATVMHKRIATGKLPTVQSILKVTIVGAAKPINESNSPCLNDHLEREPRSDE